jgi:hypothetical protein
MMNKAFQEEIVPAGQFAKLGSQALEGVVTSGLFCNIAQDLHCMAVIESTDLANCYDAVLCPIASIALQLFKFRKVIVAIMLFVLHTMNWHLDGQSPTSFGGTKDDPSIGLAQDNGATLPGFLAVSTLLINMYQRNSHGAQFTAGLAQDALILAAVLCANDSNLLHLAQGTPSDQDFLVLVQATIVDWAGLVHASGGSLKPFQVLLVYAWVEMVVGRRCGAMCLKSLSKLPQTLLLIPQPDRTMIPISFHLVDKPDKKLGVFTFPTGDILYHVGQLN